MVNLFTALFKFYLRCPARARYSCSVLRFQAWCMQSYYYPWEISIFVCVYGEGAVLLSNAIWQYLLFEYNFFLVNLSILSYGVSKMSYCYLGNVFGMKYVSSNVSIFILCIWRRIIIQLMRLHQCRIYLQVRHAEASTLMMS